jgi:hypothetical protein
VTQGHSIDVAYVRGFYKELSPALLRAAAAINGVTPPPDEDFDYCELGCGQGDTTATLAAAYPRARFVGVDLNPEHVAFARGLASRGGLGNVRFIERDFADLGREGLPGFDYVSAHGVLSWVAPEKRRALMAVAAGRLKPGGMLHVSYNAMPGWAAVEPLRRLMHETSGNVGGDLLARAQYGLGVARMFSDAGALYFESNPTARLMLGTALEAGLPYVAHEYLTPHWHPLYFADVAREMAEHGLQFVGSLPLTQGIPELAVPPSLAEVFARVTDRAAFEVLKDFATNELFRRDLFVKGDATRSDATRRAYLETTPFGTLAPAEALGRQVKLPHHVLRLDGPLFDALIPRLAARRATARELAAEPELAPFGLDAIRDAVLRLALAEHATPMRPGAPPPPEVGDGKLRVPLAYNRMILEQPPSNRHPIVLASPTTGAGLTLPMLQAVALRALTEAEPQDRPAWIRDFTGRVSLRLWVKDRAIEDREEQARTIEAELETFRARRLPKLVELGIVAA